MLHKRNSQNWNELDRVGFITCKEKTMAWEKNDGVVTQLIPNKQRTDSKEIYNEDSN